jgi:hypothetical protein
MANCKKCGDPLNDTQKFCPKCGEPVEGTAVSAAPAAVAPAAAAAASAPAPPAPPAPYAPVAAPVKASGRGKKWLWIALAALVVAIAVACVLVFAVFDDQIFDKQTGPEKAVQTFLTVMEAKDIEGFMDLLPPATVQAMEAEAEAMGMSVDAVKAFLAADVFDYDSMKFSDVKMDTTETGEGTATVTITGGTVTKTANGETETKDVRDADLPLELPCVERGGVWYVDFENME